MQILSGKKAVNKSLSVISLFKNLSIFSPLLSYNLEHLFSDIYIYSFLCHRHNVKRRFFLILWNSPLF